MPVPEPTLCGTCGTGGGGGVVLIITRGRNGDHYEPTPCPACGIPEPNRTGRNHFSINTSRA